jgi:IMP dehydrogenase
MKEGFTFDDVLIVPKFSEINSRSEVDISTNIRELRFQLPVISANMDTVTGDVMSRAMLRAGAQACIHRFGSIEDTVGLFQRSHNSDNYVSPMVSIGIGSTELQRAKALFDEGAHTFVVDVAHGAQLSVAKQVLALREILGPYVNIVAGNFATGDSVKHFLEYVGGSVDGIKVGIGPGSACTTRIKTGVGYPQLSAVLDVSRTIYKTGITVIADGGMKTAGDVCKAIAAGADMVMLGGMLSGTDETPGNTYWQTVYGDLIQCNEENKHLDDPNYWFKGQQGKKVKKYRGSASLESYKDQGKEAKHRTAEGESFVVPYKGSVATILQDIEGGLRSSLSYVGASNLKEFQHRAEFVRITGATVAENGAHGKRQ